MKAIEEAMKTDPTIHALATQFSELHESNTKAYHHAKDVLTWLFDKPSQTASEPKRGRR